MHKSGQAVSPLSVGGDLGALVASGHLVGVLCRLERERFTGAVFVEHAEASLVFSFRDGRPVFVEDLLNEQTIADEFLQRELITPAQYADVSARVVEALVESEEVAFCQQAVKCGALEQAQVDRLLTDRLRGKIIQAVPLRGCKMELDDDPDVLAGILEYPQALGPLVYMGVRTFFEQRDIEAVLGDAPRLYMRLDRERDDVARYFGLDHEERGLLERFDPAVPLRQTVEQCGADPLDAGQLVALAVLAGFGELSSAPFVVPVAEARPAPASASAKPQAEQVARTPAAPPEERPESSGPLASPAADPPPSREQAAPAPPRPAVPLKRPLRRERKLGVALKRLDRELKVRRAESGGSTSRPQHNPVESAQPRPPVPPPTPAERSHVKQLLLRRRRQLSAQQSSPLDDSQPRGEDCIPAVRRLFVQQSFAKALADLKRALEAEPDNQVLKMYTLYAELRANATLEPEPLAELKSLLRDHLTHDVHGGFVHLAFGHIMLFLKKEDAAEKYFQKALEMDKSSKDAERHLHLLEVRRKVAAKQEKGNKIFGIDIGSASSGDGPKKVFGIEIGKKKG